LFVLSLIVNLGMWLERYVIVITSLHRDFLPSSWGMYSATRWDWATYVGTIGLFLALVFLFIRFLPMISIFEMRELVSETKAGGGSGCRRDRPSRRLMDCWRNLSRRQSSPLQRKERAPLAIGAWTPMRPFPWKDWPKRSSSAAAECLRSRWPAASSAASADTSCSTGLPRSTIRKTS